MLQCNEEVIVNQKAYKLIKLLGHGKGGYSYLAENNKSLVVLKQIHHEPCDYYTFGNKIEAEINDYKRLCDACINVPKMLDVDIKSERIIKEYIDGDVVSDLVKKNRMKDEYISQVRKMAELAYKAGLNIDYYPTNFVYNDPQFDMYPLFWTNRKGVFLCINITRMSTKDTALKCTNKVFGKKLQNISKIRKISIR